MDVFKTIIERRSCRKYLETPVEFEKVTLLLEAGCNAPSTGNLQHWKYILVNEKELIRKIAGYSFQQYWVQTAPLVIVVCSLDDLQNTYYGERGSTLYAIQSTAAATQNIILTATALGLGTCWVGGFEQDQIKTLLRIPANVSVHALITVGYSAEKPEQKNLIPINSCVYFNAYGTTIAKINRVMNDYSIEVEQAMQKHKPTLDALLDKVKSFTRRKNKEK